MSWGMCCDGIVGPPCRCCDPSEIGLGDCRVDICIEWAFSMRSLSKKTSSVEDKAPRPRRGGLEHRPSP